MTVPPVIGGGGGTVVSNTPTVTIMNVRDSNGDNKNYEDGAHLKYRVNGGVWQFFEFVGEVDWFSAFDKFIKDRLALITMYGEQPSAFLFKENYDSPNNTSIPTITGAYATNSLNNTNYPNEVTSVVRAEETLFELAVSSGLGMDLVQDLFGGNVIMRSYGVVQWNINSD